MAKIGYDGADFWDFVRPVLDQPWKGEYAIIGGVVLKKNAAGEFQPIGRIEIKEEGTK